MTLRRLIILLLVLVLGVALPVPIYQYYLYQDQIEWALQLVMNPDLLEQVQQHLERLKQLKEFVPPEEAARLKQEFQSSLTLRDALTQLTSIREEVLQQLQQRTLVLLGSVLVGSFMLAWAVSVYVIVHFRRMLRAQRLLQQREQEVQRLEEWQLWLKAMVHELKRPLMPIKMIASDLVTRYDRNHSNYRNFIVEGQQLILEEIDWTENLLRHFARFAALPLPQRKTQSWQSFLTYFIHKYPLSGVSYECTVDGLPPHFQADFDAGLIEQLLYNLVKNAAEANPAGVKVHFHSFASIEFLFLKIADSGLGIPEGLREQIFSPAVTTKRQSPHANFGMGMMIAQKIALDHGGRLSLQPPAEHLFDQGACFLLKLPLCPNPEVITNPETAPKSTALS